MIVRIPVLTLVLLGLAVAAPVVRAQTINGIVKDAVTGNPVADASVVLLDRRGRIQRGTLCEADGRYEIVAPEAGSYTVRVGAMGYLTKDTPQIEIGSEQTQRVDLLLEPEDHTGGPPGLARRMQLGQGEFLTREQIEERNATYFTELLEFVPAVSVVPLPLTDRLASRFSTPGIITTQARRALTESTRDGREAARGGRAHYNTVRIKAGRDFKQRNVGVAMEGEKADECVPVLWVNGLWWGPVDDASPLGPDGALVPSDLEAIEIYNHPSIVPEQFDSGLDAWCGVIVVWTRRGSSK